MAQIKNIVEAKLKARPIKYQIPSQYERDKIDFQNSIGYFPFIWYGSYQFDIQRDITFFELSIVKKIPTIKMVFRDPSALMREKLFPSDDSKISLFLNSRSPQLKSIHLDFKIIDFKMSRGSDTCVGFLDVSELYVKQYKSFPNLSSYQALKKIAEQIGLGFNSNIDSTDDTMTWLNAGMKVSEFIDSIYEKSYASDASFLLGYIDYYYNINFVDLEKEISRDIKDDKGIIMTVSRDLVESETSTTTTEAVSPLLLSNDIVFQETNSYFDDYRIINSSTGISIKNGYTTKVKFYDRLQQDNQEFNIEPITDKSGSKIQLRGQQGDNSFKDTNLEYLWSGKLDTDNIHKNWNYASAQNDRNILELEKLILEIQVVNPNYNLYKFQKILVQISNQTQTVTQNHINQRLSGEWLIVDIKFRFTNSRFRQVVTLMRRDLELSVKELIT